ncbi:MAG: hypothetical protein P8Z36_15910 [Gemmatimonadota bacterium]|jgi:hypothetical protein
MRVLRLPVFAVLLAMPAALHAQMEPVRSFGYAGITAQVAQPVGQFADYVGTGWGLGGSFLLPFGRSPWFGLRADAGFVIYGYESRDVCFSQTVGCRVTLDLTTTNDILYAGIGPQLMLPLGPVQPYVNAAAQLSYFSTSSALNGSDSYDSFANTTNFDDLTAAWSAGGGVSIALPIRRTQVAIDVGARLHHNGVVRYLREGDIQDNADGSITLHPQRSEANLVVYHIGVRIGVH